jgi:hypothetical protein
VNPLPVAEFDVNYCTGVKFNKMSEKKFKVIGGDRRMSLMHKTNNISSSMKDPIPSALIKN